MKYIHPKGLNADLPFFLNLFIFDSCTETTVSGAEDSMETNEAAAALLNMESPNNILDEKRMRKIFSLLIMATKTPARSEIFVFNRDVSCFPTFLFSSRLRQPAGERLDVRLSETWPDG